MNFKESPQSPDNGDSKYAKVRRVLEKHREISTVKKGDDYYRLDRHFAEGYFDRHPKWEQKIRDLFSEMHKNGEQVVHLDICGRASGADLGANKTYALALGQGNRLFGANIEVVTGDIFNTQGFNNFLQKVKEGGVLPALVTFVPVAGLQEYTPGPTKRKEIPLYEKVTYRQLEKRLEDLVDILRPGGYLYISKPFELIHEEFIALLDGTPRNETPLLLHMKELAKKLKCSLEVDHNPYGPEFLLQKRAKTQKKD